MAWMPWTAATVMVASTIGASVVHEPRPEARQRREIDGEIPRSN